MLRKQKEDSHTDSDSGDDANEMETGTDSKTNEDNAIAGTSDSTEKPQKKKKRGIIYISTIPKHMNVTILREMLGQHAKLGRIFLQPGKLTSKFHDQFALHVKYY